jgi:hypothetical protein
MRDTLPTCTAPVRTPNNLSYSSIFIRLFNYCCYALWKSANDFDNSHLLVPIPQIALLLACCYALQPLRATDVTPSLNMYAVDVEGFWKCRVADYQQEDYPNAVVLLCLSWVCFHSVDMPAARLRAGRPRNHSSIPSRAKCFSSSSPYPKCIGGHIQPYIEWPIQLYIEWVPGEISAGGGGGRAVGLWSWPLPSRAGLRGGPAGRLLWAPA